MKYKDRIDAKELAKILRYEEDTGKLFWLYRPREFFSSCGQYKTWNKRFSGKEAFTAKACKGYLTGKVFGKTYLAHVVVWAVYYQKWPEDQLDHVSKDRTDNRISNLRQATGQQNCQNRRKKSGCSSLFVGVRRCKKQNKWRCSVTLNGVKTHLGSYEDEVEAAKAYDKAAKEHYGIYANLNFGGFKVG